MNAVDTVKKDTANREPKRMRRRARGSAHGLSILATGEPFVWLTGGALVLCLGMIGLLLVNVVYLGGSTFIPLSLVEVELHDGRKLLGEVVEEDIAPLSADQLMSDSPENVNPMLESLVAEVRTLENLPDAILARTESLKSERTATEERLVLARQRVASLVAALTGRLDTVRARRRFAAAATDSKRLLKAKTLVHALEGRIVGIDGEIKLAEDAATHFQKTDSDEPKSIIEAPYQFKRSAIQGLIDLVAKKRNVDEVLHRQRKMRTENFELTNTHYLWVADYQVVEGQESLPKHATLLERTENGRFYGYPTEFVEIIPFEDAEEVQALKIATEFLSANQHRLSTDERQVLVEPLAEMKADLHEARNSAIRGVIDANRDQEVGRIDLAGQNAATGEYHIFPYDENTDLSAVAGLAITWIHPDLAWKKLRNYQPDVQKKRHDKNSLQKHELGHEYARQERARLRVRQAELDYGVEVVPNVDALKTIALAESITIETIESADQAIACLKRLQQSSPDAGPGLVRIARKIRDALNQELDQVSQSHIAQREQINAEFKSLPVDVQQIVDDAIDVNIEAELNSAEIKERIDDLTAEINRFQVVLKTSDERLARIPLGNIVRAYQANVLTASQKQTIYLSRWWEFLSDEPREANSEGGVLPAIWGTVSMTIIMSLAVVPFGVLAALYLREYAKSGPIVSAVRIAINNLAGVPSIVFGVFGLGFFCYSIGAYIDGGPTNAGFAPMPPARWFVWIGTLAAVSVGAFVFGLVNLSGPAGPKTFFRRLAGIASLIFWGVSLIAFGYVVSGTPYFNGFYEANLPNPYWGKGGILWAALTLALMTLPVVIVATEETLAAVPNSMREGSYGCGASKWQTIRRVVLPQALPGIMTGMILAMARGAGEVAPLMLVGAVKLAPELPVDGIFPFVHANRSFMHLGFHIFDLGFQSQNSEAAKPVVYTTTLLLIAIITTLNLAAIWLRSYLRKRFTVGQF